MVVQVGLNSTQFRKKISSEKNSNFGKFNSLKEIVKNKFFNLPVQIRELSNKIFKL
jgi:hypothetical protein